MTRKLISVLLGCDLEDRHPFLLRHDIKDQHLYIHPLLLLFVYRNLKFLPVNLWKDLYPLHLILLLVSTCLSVCSYLLMVYHCIDCLSCLYCQPYNIIHVISKILPIVHLPWYSNDNRHMANLQDVCQLYILNMEPKDLASMKVRPYFHV